MPTPHLIIRKYTELAGFYYGKDGKEGDFINLFHYLHTH